MAERATTANKRSNIVLRRTLPALMAAFAVWALVSSFFALDITEYGLVTRFGRVVPFPAEVAPPAAGEQRLSDIILAEIGAVMGRYPASVLISTDPAKSNYQAMASEVVRRVADLARTAYGIDVVSVV